MHYKINLEQAVTHLLAQKDNSISNVLTKISAGPPLILLWSFYLFFENEWKHLLSREGGNTV